jgi:hypothetical protein
MRCLVADDSVNLSAGLWIAQVEKEVCRSGLNKRLSEAEAGHSSGELLESGKGVGCRPGTLGLLLRNADRRRRWPKHLFGIPKLDLSTDLCAERLVGPWFRLGVWTFGSVAMGKVWRIRSTGRACCSRGLCQCIR